MACERAARDLRHHEAAQHRAHRPEAHRDTATELRREVTDQRRRRHPRHPLDHAEQGEAYGSANAVSRPVSSRPPTTRFARPQRSARPAPRDANAPTALPITSTNTNSVKV